MAKGKRLGGISQGARDDLKAAEQFAARRTRDHDRDYSNLAARLSTDDGTGGSNKTYLKNLQNEGIKRQQAGMRETATYENYRYPSGARGTVRKPTAKERRVAKQGYSRLSPDAKQAATGKQDGKRKRVTK